MTLETVEKIMHEAIKAPDDEKLRKQYCDAVTDYLKESKSPDDILPFVIQGVDIDDAANYFDYLDSTPKNQIKNRWKSISKKIKELNNMRDSVMKFLAGLLSQTLIKGSNLESICGKVMSELVTMISSEKTPVTIMTYGPIMKEYLVNDLDPKTSFPRWETIEASGKTIKQFAEMLLEVTEGEDAGKYKAIRQCALQGIQKGKEKIRKEEIEKKIPKNREEELNDIVTHYISVEKQLRRTIYEAERLKDEKEKLRKNITVLETEKLELEKQIQTLNVEKEAKQQIIDKTQKKVSEHVAINEAFGALKKNDESAMLKDIASELQSEYEDFLASESDEMDTMLGEIYREKLKNIFRILDKKGIRMG